MGGRAWNTVGRGADKNQGRKEGAFLFLLTPEEGVWWSSTGLCWADGCGWQRPAVGLLWADPQPGGPRKAKPLAGRGVVPEN